MNIQSADSVVGTTTLPGILPAKHADYRMNAFFFLVLANSNPFGRVTARLDCLLKPPRSCPGLPTTQSRHRPTTRSETPPSAGTEPVCRSICATARDHLAHKIPRGNDTQRCFPLVTTPSPVARKGVRPLLFKSHQCNHNFNSPRPLPPLAQTGHPQQHHH